ncbi:hypothetical protein LguiA_029380 [Lonicera macranthoides]
MQPMSIITDANRPQLPEAEPLRLRVLWVVINFCLFVILCVILYIIALAILSPKNCKFDITKAGFESIKLFESNQINLDFWVEWILRNPEKRTSAEVHGIRMDLLFQNSWSKQLVISPPGTNFHIGKAGTIVLNAYTGLQNITVPAKYLEVLTGQLQTDLIHLDVRVQFNLRSSFWFSSISSRDINSFCSIELHTDGSFRNKRCPS